MTTETSAGAAAAFVRDLVVLVAKEDRATLAALRRGLGKAPGEAPEMYPFVVPRLPRRERPQPTEEEAYYLVAALFAAHPLPWPGAEGGRRTSIGSSFRRLSDERESGSIERRFVALLNCDRRDLAEHLRQAIGLLRASGVPVDWLRLLRDIRGWADERRWVQRDWARMYWGAALREEADEDEVDEEDQ